MKNKNRLDLPLYFLKTKIQYLIRRLDISTLVTKMSVSRLDWALSIIGSANYVEGATRIQKYGFLGFKTIKGLANKGFYNDWIASKYGPFSPSLASDIDILLSKDLIVKRKVKNNYDYWVDRFTLTPNGQVKYDEVKKNEEKLVDELKKKIVDKYNARTLMDILHDVYYQFPEFAVESRIRSEVGKRIYESDSYLNTRMDVSDYEN